MGHAKHSNGFDSGAVSSSSHSAGIVPKSLRAVVSNRSLSLIVLAGAVSISSIAFAVQPNPVSDNETAKPQTAPDASKQTTELRSEPDSSVNSYSDNTTLGPDDTASQSTNNSSANISVSVNGQAVDVPENGTTQEIITTPDGTTSVNISTNQSANGNSYNASFTTTTTNAMQNSFNHNTGVNTQTGNGSLP